MRALAGVSKADYPVGSIEVLIAEGRQPSRQRNLAAAAAEGEFLYFLDDDSQVLPGFLQKAVRHYEDPSVAAVGGPSLTPDSDSILQHAFAMALSSVFGGGGMRNRYRQTGEVRTTCDSELILCNLSFRKACFLNFGGFDERLYPNEENELMERIMRNGGKLIHDPGLAVDRSQRPTFMAFSRQLFGYGRGRGEQTVLSGIVRPITLVPPLFLFYLILLPLAHKPVYYLPLLCYLILSLFMTIFEGIRSGRPGSALLLPVVFPAFHLLYGMGMVLGVCSGRWKRSHSHAAEVTVRRVKEFGEGWN